MYKYIIEDGDELDIFYEPTASGNGFVRVFRPRRNALDNLTAAVAEDFDLPTKSRNGYTYIKIGGGGGTGFADFLRGEFARRGKSITTKVF